jgi:N-acetylneuraminic acid mutarotase
VIGGFRTNGKTSATAYRYDPVRNVWSRISEYPISMGFGGCGGTADGIVCAGGLTLAGVQPGNPEGTTDRSYGYDAATDTWTRNADMPYAVSGATYSNANGELQVATGFTDAGFDYGNTEHVIQYDSTADVWTEPLPDAPRTSVFAGYGTACFPFQVGGTRYAGPNPGCP